jgi:hypothetical protein
MLKLGSKCMIFGKDRKLHSHYRYITEIMLNHAVLCDDKDCVCYASSFNDAIVEMAKVGDKNMKDLVREILDRE